MEQERQGEIALKLVVLRLKEKGLPPVDFSREMGNIARNIEIDVEELRAFYVAIIPEYLGQLLGRNSVSLVTT